MVSRQLKHASQKPALAVVVLAAGLGKRMQSELPKALARTRECSLIEHVLQTCGALSPERIIVVIGHKGELIEQALTTSPHLGAWNKSKISFARQAQQLGTGDAVKSALPELADFVGSVLIVCGDMPLVKRESLEALLAVHNKDHATLSILSLQTNDPASYGRLVRNASGAIEKIVEARDCSPAELQINEINSAIYVVDSAFLEPAIQKLENNNNQKEYYLTDIVARAASEHQTVSALVLHDAKEIQGVNTRYELTMINQTLLEKRIRELIEQGVEMVDPRSVFIDSEVTIARGAKIGPNVQLLGKTVIEGEVQIEGTAYIIDSTIKAGAHIKLGVRIEQAVVGPRASVGPFAHLRPGSDLGAEVKIGNFVETKKAKLAAGAKASHLTYLGDCTVGEESNIGAGTITCNYDGYEKFETKIGRDVFIGSNSALVAPVTIADGATVGAGSVITKSVEKDSLAFTRAPQVQKAGWSKNKREKSAGKK